MSHRSRARRAWRRVLQESRPDFSHSMGTAGGVLFVEGREVAWRNPISKHDEGGPQASVNERHLSVHQPCSDHVVRVGEVAQRREDGVTGGVGPPTATDRFTGDQFGDTRQWPAGGLQQHPVLHELIHWVHRSDHLRHQSSQSRGRVARVSRAKSVRTLKTGDTRRCTKR
jgi:hypothetical protein